MAVGHVKVRPKKMVKLTSEVLSTNGHFSDIYCRPRFFFFFAEGTRDHPCYMPKEKKMKKNHSFKMAKFERKQGKRAHIVSE